MKFLAPQFSLIRHGQLSLFLDYNQIRKVTYRRMQQQFEDREMSMCLTTAESQHFGNSKFLKMKTFMFIRNLIEM